jgi:hypothetical protein
VRPHGLDRPEAREGAPLKVVLPAGAELGRGFGCQSPFGAVLVEGGPDERVENGPVHCCWAGKVADCTAMDSLLDCALAARARDPGD